MTPASNNSISSDTGPLMARSPLSQYRTARRSLILNSAASCDCVSPARTRIALNACGVTSGDLLQRKHDRAVERLDALAALTAGARRQREGNLAKVAHAERCAELATSV